MNTDYRIAFVNSQKLKQIQLADNLRSNLLKWISGGNVLIGFLSVVLHSTIIDQFFSANSEFFMVGWGIWIGILLIINGCLGIPGAIKQNRCLVISTLVMSVFSLLLCLTGLALSIISIIFFTHCYGGFNCGDSGLIMGLSVSLLVLMISGIVINITTIIITSLAVCSCCPSYKAAGYTMPVVTKLPEGGLPEETHLSQVFRNPNQQVLFTNNSEAHTEIQNNISAINDKEILIKVN